MNECELAWLAGLLEGEGSFFLHKGRSPRMQLEMTDEDVVRKAQSIYPELGNIVSIKARRVNWKSSWRWSLSGDQACVVMRDVLPYMGERRVKKITECLIHWDSRPPRKDPELHARLEEAAESYLAGKGTHKSLAEQCGVSRETVRRKIVEVQARLA